MCTKLFNVFYSVIIIIIIIIIIITETLVINTVLCLLRENVFVNFVSIWVYVGWQADASFRFPISLFKLQSFIP